MRYNDRPFLLIDDFRHGKSAATSNWDTDFRGAGRPLAPEDIYKVRRVLRTTKAFPTLIKRDINTQTYGVLFFDTTFTLVSGDGFYMSFAHEKEEAFRMTFRGGKVYAADTALADIGAGYHVLNLSLDLDNGTVKITFDGHIHADAYFTGASRIVSSFRCGFDGDDLGEASIGANVNMYRGYLVYDTCLAPNASALPDCYDFRTDADANAAYVDYNADRSECVYEIQNRIAAVSTLTRRFARTMGKTVCEMKYLLPETVKDASFCLLCGGKTVFTLSDASEALTYDGKTLRTHHKNVWQTLRITANTDDESAAVRLNGKLVTVLPMADADFIDGFCVTLSSDGAAKMQLADIFVFAEPKEPEDYVPAPVIPKKKNPDRYVGMNICSLWRGGHHYGWDCITPFDTNKPLMGFFDEGIPEIADWELKFMCEHGIDFQLYCWYASENDRPMIRTPWSSAIHGGHMLAKYSDTVKLALLWEASSGTHTGREGFRNFFVPYWLDHFFTDPRYMSIDNKAIMSVYAPDQLVRDFGGAAALKEDFDYLREKVREVGYDDLIILCTSDNRELLKECGFDGINAYSWGAFGYDPVYTRKCITDNTDLGFVHTVPTVSVGYNVVAWSGVRHPNITPEDMTDTLQWCVDEMLPKYDKDSWQHKLVMLSTWNEFGEGTFICPANLNRFGYLDAVRKVFLEDMPHTDVAPSLRQQRRIDMTHPLDRRTLSPLHLLPEDTNDYGVFKKYTFKDQADLDKWEFHGFTSLEIKDGVLYGHSDAFNPYMILKDESVFPFSAHRISGIRAHIRTYKPVNQMCCIQGFFSTSDDKKLLPNGLYCASEPTRVAPLTMPTRIPNMPWKGDITAFRFDPVYAEGDFELVDIEFVLAPPDKRVLVNGGEITLAVPVQMIEGRDYIPFDTKSTLPKTLSMYFEWHAAEKVFELRGVKNALFPLGSDIALIDGKNVKLSRAFELLDGIPLIESSLFADILGLTLETTGDTLYLNQ